MNLALFRFYLVQIALATSLVASNGMATERVTFTNFSQQVTLEKRGDYYRFVGKKLDVQLSGKLVVKAAPGVDASQLLQDNVIVESVTTLYAGEDNYYLVELVNTINIQQAINELIAQPLISLVQPDLLQLRNNAAYPSRDPLSAPSYNDILKLHEVWRKTRGSGVKIAIIDDGFNLKHPDLNHVFVAFQYDAETKQLGAAPKNPMDAHGTKVAGIIFAAHNGIGIDGIAPEAQLIALRQPDTWTSKTLLSFQLAQLAGADIVTCSWNSRWLMQPVAEVIEDLATRGRQGLGAAVVIAAGNQGKEIQPLSMEASIDKAIVVGSANSQQQRLKFSNFGKSVDLYAFGSPSTSTTNTDGYGALSGTSLSTAIISGQIALLIAQDPQMPLSKISDQLHSLYGNLWQTN